MLFCHFSSIFYLYMNLLFLCMSLPQYCHNLCPGPPAPWTPKGNVLDHFGEKGEVRKNTGGTRGFRILRTLYFYNSFKRFSDGKNDLCHTFSATKTTMHDVTRYGR